jgi:SynChlorMet cassette protein ScmC
VNWGSLIGKAKEGFLLRLGNGQGWNILFTEETKSLVEKWASIMEMKKNGSRGFRKMIMVRKNEEIPIPGLPGKGWKIQNLERMRLWSHQRFPHVICEIGPEDHFDLDIIRIWMATYPIYQSAIETGGLPFHACLAGREGAGVLLAAPGGGGKSTCARRLPPPWKALCDDEALIVRDPEGRYFVHPFPTWSNFFWRREDRTWDVQEYISLSAIFFIKKGKRDEAIPMGRGEAAARMYQAAQQVCLRNWRYFSAEEERGEKEKLFANACRLAQKIPAFTLQVSLQGQFWKEVEKVILKERHESLQKSSFPRKRKSRKKLDSGVCPVLDTGSSPE